MNNDRTFEELYCERHGLSADAFTTAVLKETLYPHARWLAPMVRLLSSRHFSADIEFVQSVGMLRRYRDYAIEAEEFAHHPENRGFWRAVLNVRISSRRMRRLVRSTLHPGPVLAENEPEQSATPFKPMAPGRGELHAKASR